MKKTIAIMLSVVLICLFSTTNCAYAFDPYEEALNLILSEIDKIISGATLVADCNIAIWERTDPRKRVMDAINEFLRHGNTEAGNPSPSPENMKIYIQIFGSSKEALINAKKYYEFCTATNPYETVVNLILIFERIFPDHSDVSKELQSYVIKVSQFFISATNLPVNGYTYYVEDLTTLNNEMQQIRKNIELSK